jgi:SAGA-associated factor 73
VQSFELRKGSKELILKACCCDAGVATGSCHLAGSKKRKASPETHDPAAGPAKKKNKPTPKVTKGRGKGPVDLDRQCGVINDKGLPCSRSLTCKSHSMGAKRAVEGRSRPYNDLLLDWQREHNPNFVEPVKRESKAEKKERKEKEKEEKKKQAQQAAIAAGLDPNKKPTTTAPKKSTKKSTTTGATVRIADAAADVAEENLDDLDSEAEVDELVHSLRIARDNGVIAQPLALPCDASSWFVQRRERARVCRDFLVTALGGGSASNGAAAMGLGRPGMVAGRIS